MAVSPVTIIFVVLNVTPANARLEVTVMFMLVITLFAMTRPADPVPPKNTFTLPIPLTLKLLPPVSVKTFVTVS